MSIENEKTSRIDLYVDLLLDCKDLDNLILKGHLMTLKGHFNILLMNLQKRKSISKKYDLHIPIN